MDVPVTADLRDEMVRLERIERDSEVRQLIEAEQRTTVLRRRLLAASGSLILRHESHIWVGQCQDVGEDAIVLRTASGASLIFLDAVDAIQGLPARCPADAIRGRMFSSNHYLQQWVAEEISLEYRGGGTIVGRLIAVFADHIDIANNSVVNHQRWTVPTTRIAAIHRR